MTSSRTDLSVERATAATLTSLPAPAIRSGPALAGKARAPWSEVILLASVSMFGSVAMDMYLPALPAMSANLHASAASAQATISTFLLGLACGQLVLGPLSDRLGRRLPLLGGAAVFCLASGLCAISTNVWALIGARLLQALGACTGSVIARAVVRDRYRDHEVLHVLSLLSLVFGVAPVVAPLVGGWVLAVSDWRWIFGVQALFGLAVAGVAYGRLPESRSEATRLRAQAENSVASYLALLRQPLLVGYLLTGGCSGAALFAYITSAPRMVIGELHIAPTHFGWVFGVNAIGMIGCNQINARLARRIPGDTLVKAALTVALAAGVVLAFCAATGWGGPWGVLAPLFLVISGLGFSQPNTSTSALAVDTHRAGATAALVGTAFFGIGSLAGVLTSMIPGRPSEAMAIVIVATLVLSLTSYRLLVTPQLRRLG